MSSPPFPPLPLPLGITESYLPSHDLTYHVLSAGVPSKPLLLCLHGFPELAFSWRKIMPQLASDGYHVVAYDRKKHWTLWFLHTLHSAGFYVYRKFYLPISYLLSTFIR